MTKENQLPPGLDVAPTEDGKLWRVFRVSGPLLGGFSTVFYKAEGTTREAAIQHYLLGGYAADDKWGFRDDLGPSDP